MSHAFCIDAEVTKGVEIDVKNEWRPQHVTIWLTRLCPCHFEKPEQDNVLVRLSGKLLSMSKQGLMVVTLDKGKEISPNVKTFPFFLIKDTSILFCWDSK
jgi:branched-subunit amino acid transport protein AzlD